MPAAAAFAIAGAWLLGPTSVRLAVCLAASLFLLVLAASASEGRLPPVGVLLGCVLIIIGHYARGWSVNATACAVYAVAAAGLILARLLGAWTSARSDGPPGAATPRH